MPKGVCDPSPDPYHVMELAVDEGRMLITFRYGWDGVSVFPNCEGPLIGVRVQNTGTLTWYVHVTGPNGDRTFQVDPGMQITRNAAWLSARGMDSYSDVKDAFSITPDP